MTGMVSKNWIFLSYELNTALSSYGNGQRIDVNRVNSIENGNSSNNSLINIPSHFGTHIDYPYHFSDEGLNGSSFTADSFVFNHVRIIDISKEPIQDYLIRNANLAIKEKDALTDFLLIKTNFGLVRNVESYWKYNWGFSSETAGHLKSFFPNLKAIGFDLMSLSSFQKRDMGRLAHKEFLINNDILIIEDMDLKEVSQLSIIEEIIISPLRFHNADGAPVTVFAKINQND